MKRSSMNGTWLAFVLGGADMGRTYVLVPGLWFVLCTAGSAQSTALVSLDSNEAQANSASTHASVSSGGRFVAFESTASNLVPGDTNDGSDVFVRDSLLLTTTRVSVDSLGVEGNLDSTYPHISADGRFVAFEGLASNLVAGDTNGVLDVIVHDRLTGSTERASVDSSGGQANRASGSPSISGDGRFVAFDSAATNLVLGDTNLAGDVFVHDRQTGTTERVSVDAAGGEANGSSHSTSISSDGRYVAFYSHATDLVPGDVNGLIDVFVRDRQAGTTQLVSVNSSGGQGNGASYYPEISGDGRFVAFESSASNLVTGDTFPYNDIFVHDRQTGATERVSVDSNGAQAFETSFHSSISEDGERVAFASSATNLVPGDTNSRTDIFVKNRRTGMTMRVSLRSGGVEANGDCDMPYISPDGQFVTFTSGSTNLFIGDFNQEWDVFLRNRGAPQLPFCFGDGKPLECPCGNNGAPMHGCDNSEATGGAILSASGVAEHPGDTLVFTCSGERTSALSIVLQGTIQLYHTPNFGDGRRCVGGNLKRLYVKSAVGGVVTAPQASDPSVSARSAALGDVIAPGSGRLYQVYYRDSSPTFCPSPPGNTFNISSGLLVTWDA